MGDQRALERLIECHQDRVLGIATRFLGNRADAEDVAQEVFVAVYRSAPRYEPRGRFTTWLFTIVRNACIKAARRRSRRPEEAAAGPSRETGWQSVRDSRPDGEQRLLESEKLAAIRAAVGRLPEKLRMALLLRQFEGLGYDEVARVLECSSQAARLRVHRARLEVARALVERGSGRSRR